MKVVTSSRRQLVMAVLLGLATLGAAMRYWAPDPSLLRDIGTLLLVLWLPAVGNLVGFVIGKIPRRARLASDFSPSSPFTSHLRAELSPLPSASGSHYAIDPAQRQCTVILGKQGFTARLALPLGQWLETEATQTLELEFLRPAVALPGLPRGTVFHVLAGTAVVGKGLVI